jgi:hypothetical protein
MYAAFNEADRASAVESRSAGNPCCARVEFTSSSKFASVEGAPWALGATIAIKQTIVATWATNDPPVFLIVVARDDALRAGYLALCNASLLSEFEVWFLQREVQKILQTPSERAGDLL